MWAGTLAAAVVTLARVLVSTAVGTLWAVPAGLAIGLSPRLSRIFQPVVQVAASFPAPMLFPLVIAVLAILGVSLGWGAVLLMLLGTQWYILFNVIAGAMAVPADLREAARSYRLSRWQRFRYSLFAAVFPLPGDGLGHGRRRGVECEHRRRVRDVQRRKSCRPGAWAAKSTRPRPTANFPLLAASVLVMSAMVVLFNRLVWRRLYDLAERRFSLSK